MKCVDMSVTGTSVAVIGVIVVGARQTAFRNDFSITGQVIGFLGVCAVIGGIGMYRASTDPKNCEGAGFF
jgi:type IV secretory pathway VirB2 component (pilin)